jgi:hypothetical protein
MGYSGHYLCPQFIAASPPFLFLKLQTLLFQAQPLALEFKPLLLEPLLFQVSTLGLVAGLLRPLIGNRIAPVLRASGTGHTANDGAGYRPTSAADDPADEPATEGATEYAGLGLRHR